MSKSEERTSKAHDGSTLAVLTLGAFSSVELGDIDIEIRHKAAELLQRALVSEDDVQVELVSAVWSQKLLQQIEQMRESSNAHQDALLQICTALGMPSEMNMQVDGPALANSLRNLLHHQDRQLAERDALLRTIRRNSGSGQQAVIDSLIGPPPAPLDATHIYPAVKGDRKYRRQIDGVWHEFGSEWLPLDTQDMAHLYVEIDAAPPASPSGLREDIRRLQGPLSAQHLRKPVAHCFLRRNDAGDWINDAKCWADGAPGKDLVDQANKHPDRYRVRIAYEEPSDTAELQRLHEALSCALKSAENINGEVIALHRQLAERDACAPVNESGHAHANGKPVPGTCDESKGTDEAQEKGV